MIFNEIAERELDTVDDELLSLLSHELGQILDWEKLCSEVYSLNVQLNPDSEYSCGEFYLVLEGAPISREALALGRALDGIPGLLYAIDPPDEGAWTAIMYELCKKQLAHGIPAMEGMELCPAYFGSFPVPPRTPWGWTLRHRPLDNGIYWMETDQGKTVLAVCSPVWSTEFSNGVARAGKKLVYGKKENEELGRTRIGVSSVGGIPRQELC